MALCTALYLSWPRCEFPNTSQTADETCTLASATAATGSPVSKPQMSAPAESDWPGGLRFSSQMPAGPGAWAPWDEQDPPSPLKLALDWV